MKVTELGEQFILALAEQGWGLIFGDEDVIAFATAARIRIHIPKELLTNPDLELLLMVVVERFIVDFGLRWALPDEEGGAPGMN